MTREQRIAEVASAQHAVFTVRQAHEHGFSPDNIEWQVRKGRWRRPAPKVLLIAGVPPSWEQRLLVACWAGPSGAVASHRAAARLWQLPVTFNGLEITVLPARWHIKNVIAHESTDLKSTHTRRFGVIPATGIERTLVDLGAVVKPSVVEECADDALRRDLTNVTKLREMHDAVARRGRSGVRALRAAIDSRDPAMAPPESVLERRLLRLILANGLRRPNTQFTVEHNGNRFRFDFAYPERKIAIEVDSYQWHGDRAKFERDLARRTRLTASGWTVHHVTANQIRGGAVEVIAALQRALSA